VDPDLASRARARLAAIAVSESTVTAARRDGENAAAHGRPTASAATLPQTQPSVRERLLAAGADPERLLPSTPETDREELPTPAKQGGRRRRGWLWQIPAGIVAVGLIAVSVAFLLRQTSETTDARSAGATKPTEDTNGAAAGPTDTAARPPTKKRGKRPAPPTPATRTFVWPPVSGVAFYRVEFFTRGRKVFEASPTKPRLTLPTRWIYKGRTFRLSRGTYRWRVRPAFGRSSPRLGTPITRSKWTVR
jgi:hypothetical protein